MGDSAANSPRITVDMSLFFKDHRKFCWVYLDMAKMKTVKDLKKYLQYIFPLDDKDERDLELMMDGCLLLDDNHLSVLRDGDHLSVIDTVTYTGAVPDNVAASSLQQKIQSPVTEEKTGIQSKIPEETRATSCTNDAGCSQNINNCATTSPSNLSTANNSSLRCVEAPKENCEDVDISPLKKKRKRKHKKNKQKNKEQEDAVTPVDCGDGSSLNGFSPKPVKKNAKPHLHIRFEDTVESMDCTEPIPEHSTTGAKSINVTKEKNFGKKRLHVSAVKPTTKWDVTDAEANDVSKQTTLQNSPNNDLSYILTLTKPIICERKFPPKNESSTNSKKKEHASDYWENLTEEKIWENPAATECPGVNDIIAFKVLHLDVNYTPQLSPWIIAQVNEEPIDKDILSLNILRGSNPYIRDTNGKFEVENTQEDQDTKLIIIPWQEIMTPRKLTSDTN